MMDAAMTSTMHLVPHWIKRLLEECEQEGKDNESWHLRLLEREARKTIWYMCTLLGVDKKGVPGQACRLMERFILIKMRNSAVLPENEWREIKRSLLNCVPIIIVSCVQLAAKITYVGVHISAETVRLLLLSRGISFSVKEINKTEFEIFSTLGFYIPLWTSVEIAEMLAIDVGLRMDQLRCVALITDIAEFRRDWLDRKVRWAAAASPSPNFNKSNLRTLHLAAGSVAASTRFINSRGSDPKPRLAKLVRVPLCYIQCISDVIVSSILTEDSPISEPPEKRVKL